MRVRAWAGCLAGVCLFAISVATWISAETSKGIEAYRAGDYQTAFREFFGPAEEGDAVAQFSLGIIYYFGRGVPTNHNEARRWYRLAAEQGYDRARVNLGVMCAAGEGGPSDPIVAYMWFSLAAAQGNAAGREARDALAQRLTPDQLAAGRKWALEWEPKRPGPRC